jgi:hypothetical protein
MPWTRRGAVSGWQATKGGYKRRMMIFTPYFAYAAFTFGQAKTVKVRSKPRQSSNLTQGQPDLPSPTRNLLALICQWFF